MIGPVRANVHRSSEEGGAVGLAARRVGGGLIAFDFTRGREWLNAVFSPLKIGYIGGRLVGVYVSCPGRVRRIWRFIRIGGVIEHV